MMTPLAKTRARRHFTFMRTLFIICAFMASSVGQFAYAQVDIPEELQNMPQDVPAPELEGPVIEVPEIPVPKNDATTETQPEPKKNKDLTVRSEEGRAEMLAQLFLKLKYAEDEETGTLIAEEIWAVFLQSGSHSVDFALLRGIAAQTHGDKKLARRMFDHVTRLQPNYAEGWSRSGRLALLEDDMDRAVSDITQSLILEPRHFYSLWMLGNILEKLGKQDEAFEAYNEAFKLYPEHKEIKERVEFLKEDVKGKAL